MKVVIVGCTHAGVAAAKAIRHDHPEAEVLIYERDDNVSFLSCGIALYLGGEVSRLEDMFYETPEHLRELGVHVRDQHDVLRIDSEQHTLTVQNLRTAEVFTDTYDKLIMTTGSNVVVPPVLGGGRRARADVQRRTAGRGHLCLRAEPPPRFHRWWWVRRGRIG